MVSQLHNTCSRSFMIRRFVRQTSTLMELKLFFFFALPTEFTRLHQSTTWRLFNSITLTSTPDFACQRGHAPLAIKVTKYKYKIKYKIHQPPPSASLLLSPLLLPTKTPSDERRGPPPRFDGISTEPRQSVAVFTLLSGVDGRRSGSPCPPGTARPPRRGSGDLVRRAAGDPAVRVSRGWWWAESVQAVHVHTERRQSMSNAQLPAWSDIRQAVLAGLFRFLCFCDLSQMFFFFVSPLVALYIIVTIWETHIVPTYLHKHLCIAPIYIKLFLYRK